MKSKLFEIITAIVVISIIFFLAGAFGHASLSITEWSEDVRGIMATMWVVIVICIIIKAGADEK